MVNTTPVFRPLLLSAWRILWRYPWVFLFGFFASFLGIGGFWELLVHAQQTSAAAARVVIGLQAAFATDTFTKIFLGVPRAIMEAPGAIILSLLLFLAILAVVLVFLWGAAVSHSALIDTTVKKTLERRTTVNAAWAVGRRFSLPVLAVHLLAKVVIGASFFLSGVMIAATVQPGIVKILLAFLVFVILLAVALTMTLLTMYASAYIVIRGFTVRESFRAALLLFRAHWLISIECATLFFFCSILLGFLVFITLLLLTIPFVMLFMILAASAVAGTGVLIAFWSLLALIVLGLATAFFSAWQIMTWTLLFLRLTEEGATPKIIRLTKRLGQLGIRN